GAVTVEPRHLVGLDSDAQGAGALEVGVDPIARHRLFDRVEVGEAEFVEAREFFGPAALAVRRAVREARFDESAVASGCGPADLVRLEDDDPTPRLAFESADGGPQSRVAATDDREVGIPIGGQPG